MFWLLLVAMITMSGIVCQTEAIIIFGKMRAVFITINMKSLHGYHYQNRIREVSRMDDLISRQAAIDAVWFEPSYTDLLNVLTEVRDRLEQLPSADVAPVWHGRWKKNDDYTCSLCSYRMVIGDGAYNYCPNCGARMDGDGNEID